jgi:uncharacterized protein (TIGR00661 family)
LIQLLLNENFNVRIAADGPIASLLKKEFPGTVILPLKGYKISYPDKGAGFFWAMLKQVPQLLSVIRYENNWLKEMVQNLQPDLIISDNRYGLHHKTTPCIFITHQLNIQTGNSWLNKIIRKINYRYINRFTRCWIPDTETSDNLAGELAHPAVLPEKPVDYIGPLSRFSKKNLSEKITLTILLSGPEPQRTIFENILLGQITNVKGTIVFVRGLPDAFTLPVLQQEGLVFYNHLPAGQLEDLLNESQLIVCRSGYSTIMDLIALEKKAILVPTPGQTEQEYLADSLFKKGIFYTAQQENFSLLNAHGILPDI